MFQVTWVVTPLSLTHDAPLLHTWILITLTIRPIPILTSIGYIMTGFIRPEWYSWLHNWRWFHPILAMRHYLPKRVASLLSCIMHLVMGPIQLDTSPRRISFFSMGPFCSESREIAQKKTPFILRAETIMTVFNTIQCESAESASYLFQTPIGVYRCIHSAPLNQGRGVGWQLAPLLASEKWLIDWFNWFIFMMRCVDFWSFSRLEAFFRGCLGGPTEGS